METSVTTLAANRLLRIERKNQLFRSANLTVKAFHHAPLAGQDMLSAQGQTCFDGALQGFFRKFDEVGEGVQVNLLRQVLSSVNVKVEDFSPFGAGEQVQLDFL